MVFVTPMTMNLIVHSLLMSPHEIVRWMQLKAYGTPDPLPDDNPLNGRSSSLEYSYKKALSHFMPNNLMQWNELASVGNPTKSTAVNAIIKRVKKKEVRREGVPS